MPDVEVVCITGTSKGIGAYLTEHYAKLGYLVEGCSRSSVESAAGELQAPLYRYH